MPKRNVPSEFGDLHIKMKVKMPTTLTLKQKEILRMIFPDEAGDQE